MTTEDLIVALIGIALLFYLFWPKPARRQKPAQAPKSKPQEIDATPFTDHDSVPNNAIVIDGSNVMYWGGDPSSKVIAQVVHALENRGLAPIVIFDASVGYRLSDRYMTERALAPLINTAVNRIYVVHKGVVADEVILDFAREHNLRIVTNDRYRDWSVQFPLVKKKGRLVKGTCQQGSIIFPGL